MTFVNLGVLEAGMDSGGLMKEFLEEVEASHPHKTHHTPDLA